MNAPKLPDGWRYLDYGEPAQPGDTPFFGRLARQVSRQGQELVSLKRVEWEAVKDRVKRLEDGLFGKPPLYGPLPPDLKFTPRHSSKITLSHQYANHHIGSYESKNSQDERVWRASCTCGWRMEAMEKGRMLQCVEGHISDVLEAEFPPASGPTNFDDIPR